MFEPEVKWVKDLEETYLKCPFCLDGFNQTDRRPHLLHECLHAYCTGCLDKLIQTEGGRRLTCPICRHIATVNGKATSFPADILRSKLLERERLSTPHFCTKHPNKKLELVCSNDGSLCCASCAGELDHKGHKFDSIEEAWIQGKRDLQSRLHDIQTHVFTLKNQRHGVENNKSVLLKEKKAMQEEINKEFSKLESKIKKRQEDVLKEVEENSQGKLAVCDKNMQAIDESLAVIESKESYIKQACKKLDEVEMMQMLPVLKDSLVATSDPSSSSSSPDASEQTPRVVFDPCFVSTAEKMILQIGQLEVQSGADQPSGAREYRDCVQKVMSVCLDSRDSTELRKRINQLLDKGEGSTWKKPPRSQANLKPKLVKIGDRIPGEMTNKDIEKKCEGYENFNTIEIRYHIPSGSTVSPGSPAQHYDKVNYTAYLPNNREGQKVLSLLKVAWRRGFTYKFEEGRWRIKISHKEYMRSTIANRRKDGSTRYPDPDYLQRVQDELRLLGVTEADI